jgi:ABC-2 type transport system permease protein
MEKKSFKNIIKEGIRDSFIIWKEEFRKVFSDAGVIIFFFVAPLIYPVIYAFIYDKEIAEEVPMVVVDHSNTARSREFIRLCDATRDVRIIGKCANIHEGKIMMKQKKAYAIMYIPSDFNKNIVRGEKAYISLFSDMSSLLYYKAFLLTLTEVSLHMGNDIQIENMGGATVRQEEINTAPFTYQHINFFNPASGFASFLIPAVLILVIQQTLLLGIGIIGGDARDHNLYQNLIPMQRHYRGTFRIVFGKTLCYMMIYSLITVYLLWIIPHLFRLPQMGNGFAILLFALPYLLACIFFSMTMTLFVHNRESPFILFVFTSILLLFISGVSWPAAAIPWYWKWISYLFPSTFGIQGFIKLNSMGATLHGISFEYMGLWIQAFVYFLSACLVYRWQIIRSKRLNRKDRQGYLKKYNTQVPFKG